MYVCICMCVYTYIYSFYREREIPFKKEKGEKDTFEEYYVIQKIERKNILTFMDSI